MVTDQQVRRLFDVQNKYEYQYQAADAAGISSKTAHKYLKSGKLPSQCRLKALPRYFRFPIKVPEGTRTLL